MIDRADVKGARDSKFTIIAKMPMLNLGNQVTRVTIFCHHEKDSSEGIRT